MNFMTPRMPYFKPPPIVIKVLPSGDVQDDRIYPVGHFRNWTKPLSELPAWYMLADGSELPCDIFPGLFAIFGHTYSPRPSIIETLPMPAWKVVLMLFGFRFKPVTIARLNPEYRPGYFRLPDMRGWMKGDRA